MTTDRVRYLVLWLTTACNLRCAYCYRGEQPAMVMPLEVVRAALRLAGASGLPFHVQLAGGEPTLEPGSIEAIGRMVRSAGWPATMALQTNATLLDGRLLAVCKRYRIDINVSIDGPPPVQERIRGNAKASFHGLELLSRSQVPVCATAVLSDANVAYLAELILCLASFSNVRGLGLDPLVRKGNGATRTMDVPAAAIIRDNVFSMLGMLKGVNQLRTSPMHWREYDAVIRSLKGNSPMRPYCHACCGESLAVHPDGTVYPCGQTVGDPAKAAGTVDHVDWARLKGVFQGLRLQGICRKCPLAERCPGDCPSRLQYNGCGTSNVMCRIYRSIAEWVAEEETL